MILRLFPFLLVSAAVLHAQPKLNVVLVVCDDWSRDAGCFGNPGIETPHIDALAREGTRFERAYCTSASCSASRSVILTGLHNHATGQYGHTHDYHHFSAFSKVRSLPVLLGEAGYRTARIGKYHVAPEEVFRFDQALSGNDRNGVAMSENSRPFIAANDERPFFLYFCTSDPHRGGGPLPGHALKPDAFGNHRPYPGIAEIVYDPKDVIVPPWLPDTPECRSELAQYYQSVSRMDQGLGKLVQVLKETGQYDRTVIIITSDNGIAFPGSKTNLYEPGMHLPLIVRVPGQANPGGISNAMVSWVDFTPTILDFAGAPPPEETHGRSWAKLVGRDDAQGWDEIYASHTFHEITMYYPMRVVQTRRWKLIFNIAHPLPYPFASDLWRSATWQGIVKSGQSHYGGRLVSHYLQRPRYELYDKEADPNEFQNLAGDAAHAGVLEELAAKVKAFQKQTGDPWFHKHEYE
jgi:N-sulfoglucosamine sulfohydrolase